MARRIEVVELCDHGYDNDSCEYMCPGGFRRVLDPGSYVFLERQGSIWPKYANDALYRWATTEMTVGADDFWDALAGGEQP